MESFRVESKLGRQVSRPLAQARGVRRSNRSTGPIWPAVAGRTSPMEKCRWTPY